MPFIGDIGIPGLIIILIIALIVLGPGRLPEAGEAIGKGIREFRKAIDMTPDKSASTPVPAAPPETAEEQVARLTRERDALAAELKSKTAAAPSDGGSAAS